MKWKDTIASHCRYGYNAGEIFGDADIIFEDSEADWQGGANVFAYLPSTNQFVHYAWSYGSCSGCDTWMALELTDEQIVEEMRNEAAYFDSIDTVLRYLRTNDDMPHYSYSYDEGITFLSMGAAFLKWLETDAKLYLITSFE